METFIYQHEFVVDPVSRKLLESHFNVIPCRITSVADASSNNYQPTPIEDPDASCGCSKGSKSTRSTCPIP